jgi:hypothetical protein
MASKDGTAQNGHRVVVLESDSRRTVNMPVGEEQTVGRLGDLALGAAPEDLGVSRLALRITAAPGAWRVHVSNSAGAWVQPWMAPRRFVNSDHWERFHQPRVCIDVIGAEDLRHRVLLERDGDTTAEPRSTSDLTAASGRSGVTMPATDPRQLTDRQLAILLAVFGDYFAWPPKGNPHPTKFKTAGRAAGVTDSAVKDHLGRMRARVNAHSFGHVDLDNPLWVYALVDIGLVVFPGVLPPARPPQQVDVRHSSTSDPS